MSYLAWIDFDPDERRRAQTLIDLFKQPEARDELGLGSVRDAIADLLFPSTSTIQTRLRYMLFIPWIYREAQRRKGTPAERVAFARDLEFQLSEALLAGGETTGVIGRDAGRNLKRLASSVYWAGLHTLGIRPMAGTPNTFLSYGPESLRDHDLRLWSSNLPEPPEDLFETCDFDLDGEEADFLRDRFAISAKSSLLNELAIDGGDRIEQWPWQIGARNISDTNRAILDHAERFSGVMYGASVLYNLLLARRAGDNPNASKHAEAEELCSRYTQELEDWHKELQLLKIDAWDVDGLFALVGRTSHNLRSPTRSFIREWIGLAQGGAISLQSDDRAIELLRRREHGLKRGKARLLHDGPLERWSGASGHARLDFRWGITRNYLTELADAG